MRNPLRSLARDAGADLETRLVWILGAPRSGSTWLLNLIARDPRVIKSDEPAIGAHLGLFVAGLMGNRPNRVAEDRLRVNDVRADAQNYFFCDRYESIWRPLVRNLVLGRLGAEVAEVAAAREIRDPMLVIKEPNGSQGADVLMTCLPGSRLLFLLRDGRDVIDSELDASAPGSWAATYLEGYTTSDHDRLGFIRERAHAWLSRIATVQRAYGRHPDGLRMTVRYEELVADTPAVFRSVRDWLALDIPDEALDEAVAELSFERQPERGLGHFVRAATPGLWRQNLSAEEQRAIDEVIGAKLRELGY